MPCFDAKIGIYAGFSFSYFSQKVNYFIIISFFIVFFGAK